MQFKIIVAMCQNNGIGINQKLPWRLKEDLKHFSKLTKGNGNNAIVMGKNTWKSIGCTPLPKRDNLILSKTLHNEITECGNESVKIFDSIENMKLWCHEKKYEEIWVIGGQSIYEQFINDENCNEMYITQITKDFTCDTFFPEIDNTRWSCVKETPLEIESNCNLKDSVIINLFAKIYN